MRVLVACEFSGVVRRAFSAPGREVWSCDLLPSEDGSDFHYQGDVLDILDYGWDLLIAHPPCTRLANSGVRWLHERNLWEEMEASARFFKTFLDAPVRFKAVENPVMHRYAREIVGRGPDFSVQPWQFGHPETKRTCYWTENLPRLNPTDVVEGREPRVWRLPPSADRAKLRSITYTGVAEAKAAQWAPVVESYLETQGV